MNIQIFGKKKCFDTKKAERYFKERGIKVQQIDIVKYGISPGELKSVAQALGGISNLVDTASKEYTRQNLAYLANNDLDERLEATPELFKTPIVRNGKKATLGYAPHIWKEWE